LASGLGLDSGLDYLVCDFGDRMLATVSASAPAPYPELPYPAFHSLSHSHSPSFIRSLRGRSALCAVFFSIENRKQHKTFHFPSSYPITRGPMIRCRSAWSRAGAFPSNFPRAASTAKCSLTEQPILWSLACSGSYAQCAARYAGDGFGWDAKRMRLCIGCMYALDICASLMCCQGHGPEKKVMPFTAESISGDGVRGCVFVKWLIEKW
jgi:hypothetical protein